MNKYHLNGSPLGMTVSTELLHQPRATCRYISLEFKARLLCKHKGLQPTSWMSTLMCWSSRCSFRHIWKLHPVQTGTPRAQVSALPQRPPAQTQPGRRKALAMASLGEGEGLWGQKGKDRKIIVNHGNWERRGSKEEFFSFAEEGWKRIRNGKENSD